MFDLPSLEGVAKVVLDEHNIEEDTKPLLVYREAKGLGGQLMNARPPLAKGVAGLKWGESPL
jgi:hypothetical protein